MYNRNTWLHQKYTMIALLFMQQKIVKLLEKNTEEIHIDENIIPILCIQEKKYEENTPTHNKNGK